MKISIVMPSFNQGRFVESAIRSVISQDYENWELLFLDAGSTDETMEVVERYRSRLAYCYSGRDDGQSDALSRGFSMASGSVYTWLNTDDILMPGALKRVAMAFQSNSERPWLLGNVIWIDEQERILKCWRGEGYTPGWMRLGNLSAGGPSAFFTRELYDKVGGVDTSLHYQMDTDLWWRFAMAGAAFHRLPGYIWAMRLHKDAKVSGHMFAAPNDAKQIKVLAARKAEWVYVSQKSVDYRRYESRLYSPLLQKARKLLSPAYLSGIFDNLRYKNLSLSVIADRYSTRR